MSKIDDYYNKFNEDKRLDTRRGRVEYCTNMKYIHKYLNSDVKIIDIGAGTGKYSISLYEEGYDVTAVELVLHNLQVIRKKNPNIKAYQMNALDMHKFKDNSFDVALLFGPMYHLKDRNDLIRALEETKRIVKDNGIIIISYCMNEYAVITHGFKDNNIIKNINNGEVDDNFHVTLKGNDLYNYVRLEDIDELNKVCNLKRLEIVASDGCASYIKEYLNKMSEDEFKVFLNYHLATCERADLLGASTHLIDIIEVNKC